MPSSCMPGPPALAAFTRVSMRPSMGPSSLAREEPSDLDNRLQLEELEELLTSGAPGSWSQSLSRPLLGPSAPPSGHSGSGEPGVFTVYSLDRVYTLYKVCKVHITECTLYRVQCVQWP